MLPGRNYRGGGRAMGASRLVLLCGYYGEHNIGDDALLAALLLQLPPAWTPLVTGYDQAELEQRFDVATCPRRRFKAVLAALGRCDALILGGGSLLQDSTSWRSLLYYVLLIGAARLTGKPVLLWLPFHRGQDTGLLERLRAEGLVPETLAVRSRECQLTSPEQAMELFAGAGLVLAMRLHGLILAALASAPCCALSYDPKVAAAASAIDCPCLDLEAPLPPVSTVAAHWQAQLDRPLEPGPITAQRQAARVHGALLQRLP